MFKVVSFLLIIKSLGGCSGCQTNQSPSFSADDNELNHWMLAMIGIGCIFIAFVGVSIYLMW